MANATTSTPTGVGTRDDIASELMNLKSDLRKVKDDLR